MKKILPLLLVVLSAAIAHAQPASPLDGTWRGRSDGGSCNAPLDYAITIEEGFVDGTAFDTTAHGPARKEVEAIRRSARAARAARGAAIASAAGSPPS
jgi:hypothetical protein